MLPGSAPLAPVRDDFILQLFSTPIKTTAPEKMHRHFVDTYTIELPVMWHGNKVYLRYSIKALNSQLDLDKLFVAIQR